MKNIAVLIPSFTIEYSIDILNGIYDYFEGKDVRLLISHTRFPHSTVSSFDYQYWTSFEYLKAKDIDGYIIVSGLYVSSMSFSDFENIVSELAPRPVVSIGVELDMPHVYTVKSDCTETYDDVVKHLKLEHGCKRIAFCSANKTFSEEAIARYNAFTHALKKNHLPFYPDLVIEGYFTEFAAKEEFLLKYKSKDDIDFDSIVCANDLMASGCVMALKELGLKVPDDIKIVGFDDSIVSRISIPKLSTINQNIHEQGVRAADFLMDLLEKEDSKREKVKKVSLFPKFRQSCGCISCDNLESSYIDRTNTKVADDLNGSDDVIRYFANMQEKNNIMTLMDTLRCSNTLKQFFYNLRFLAEQCQMSQMYVNFFKDVIYLDPEDIFEIPEQLELSMICNLDNNTNSFKPGSSYNPKEQFFSSKSDQNNIPGAYIIHPIFSGANNYGLMYCKIQNKNFADHIVHLKIISNYIAQAYEYTNQITQTEKLQTSNDNLKIQSRTDELTTVLNRRGFIEQGQAALDLMQETDKAGVIFFADMDGLKVINDKYGHEMGDKAIRLQAEILKNAFRSTDIVGRIGGDEFGVVAVGMNISRVDNIRLKINLLSEKISKTNDLPFTLSCSLGAVDLQKSSVLKRLLSEADKELYEEKRAKRNARLLESSK